MSPRAGETVRDSDVRGKTTNQVWGDQSPAPLPGPPHQLTPPRP